MAQEVKLFKKSAPWTDKDGVVHDGKNLYVMCGDLLIPVRIVNFSTDDNPDKQYRARRAVFEAFAEELPEREGKENEAPVQEKSLKKKAVPSRADEDDASDDSDGVADPC